ncbi:hypothetical protein FNU76_01845 [Chitinimonas arctica]|uniref:Uncharacterized protein n=1 Tax=Chitinimonas arctica TaxID=2594795 RepID=A0A516SAM3_9NEIS|nr:hypothetical protein [Chitinimonas arctica]QDQ25196.1 hypothetical protein FNU76_01845 [Chitinimonas arctica]
MDNIPTKQALSAEPYPIIPANRKPVRQSHSTTPASVAPLDRKDLPPPLLKAFDALPSQHSRDNPVLVARDLHIYNALTHESNIVSILTQGQASTYSGRHFSPKGIALNAPFYNYPAFVYIKLSKFIDEYQKHMSALSTSGKEALADLCCDMITGEMMQNPRLVLLRKAGRHQQPYIATVCDEKTLSDPSLIKSWVSNNLATIESREFVELKTIIVALDEDLKNDIADNLRVKNIESERPSPQEWAAIRPESLDSFQQQHPTSFLNRVWEKREEVIEGHFTRQQYLMESQYQKTRRSESAQPPFDHRS